ncbi:galactosylceramide sulfotransferase-like isoform X2 [Anneissia japonica]|nr:galactosylceramide sulfotransferase-like isoform X2 [Anneissia japonica]
MHDGAVYVADQEGTKGNHLVPNEKQPNIAKLREKLSNLLNISQQLQQINDAMVRSSLNLKTPGRKNEYLKLISKITREGGKTTKSMSYLPIELNKNYFKIDRQAILNRSLSKQMRSEYMREGGVLVQMAHTNEDISTDMLRKTETHMLRNNDGVLSRVVQQPHSKLSPDTRQGTNNHMTENAKGFMTKAGPPNNDKSDIRKLTEKTSMLYNNNTLTEMIKQQKELSPYIRRHKVNFGETELILGSEQSDREQPLLLHIGKMEEYKASYSSKDACKPKNNICFLKTHKCSSSTIQNILYRWGDDHNLMFVLPKSECGPYLGNPYLFNRTFAVPSAIGKYNILANHARYSKQGMSEIMPSDSIYITVLRDPAKQYESIYDYYGLEERYGIDLSGFLNQPNVYYQFGRMDRFSGRNPMLFDLGLDARQLEVDDPKIDEWIGIIDNDFHLVLIAEFFQESMILLKNELCWTLADVTSFKQNERIKPSVRTIDTAEADKIRKWNGGDWKLYTYFNTSLRKKIETFGVENMKHEVALLKKLNDQLSQNCIGTVREFGDSRMWYPSGVQIKSFLRNPQAKDNRLCSQLTRPELSYISLLRKKQYIMNIQYANE